MKKALFFTIFISATFAFAGEHASQATDILPRTVNFLIFAAILYYLLADIVKNFFKGRSASIAAELESVQAKLKEAKDEKEKAQKELEKAKKLASEIVEIAKKEANMISENIKKSLEDELKLLEKQYKESCELEERKMVRDIVKSVLEETLEDKSIAVNEKDFVNLIVKKVG